MILNYWHETTYYRTLVVGSIKKKHAFDLGSKDPKIIIECKSHTWTEGNKVPVAKMTVLNEAMYYFHLVPNSYKKIFFVKHDKRKKSGMSLLNYYLNMYSHLVPHDVDFIEYDESSNTIIEQEKTEPNKALFLRTLAMPNHSASTPI